MGFAGLYPSYDPKMLTWFLGISKERGISNPPFINRGQECPRSLTFASSKTLVVDGLDDAAIDHQGLGKWRRPLLCHEAVW